MSATEFVTVYSAALEREAIKAQQRPAPYPVPTVQYRQYTSDDVYRFLSRFPESWWTMREVTLLLRLSPDTVNNALYRLIRAGLVERMIPNYRGRKGVPQRYRVTA